MDLRGLTVVFDLDGTLVDTAPDLIGALNAVLAERGLAKVPLASARHLVGKGAKALIARGFAEAGEPLDAAEVAGLTERFIAAYRARIAEESRPFAGVVEALDALAEAGAVLCVCTNKFTDLSIELLDALALTRRFAAVVGVDRAPARKPDPAHVLAAIAAAGGDPARAIMVGDSANDVDAARAAGAPTILVAFGYTETPAAELGADQVIEAFDELPAAVARLAGELQRRRASAIAPPS